MPALWAILEARIIRPTGMSNHSTVPAKPRVPSQNNLGRRRPVTVSQTASRAIENFSGVASQRKKRMGAGQKKCRSLPPRSSAQMMCRLVSVVTIHIATLQPPTRCGSTMTAESRSRAMNRAGQSTSQMPRTMPPNCPARRTPMKPSRKRPVRAMVALACSR